MSMGIRYPVLRNKVDIPIVFLHMNSKVKYIASISVFLIAQKHEGICVFTIVKRSMGNASILIS